MPLPVQIEKGPSQTQAFIPSADVMAIAETMIAFANAEGGTLFIGLSADGMIYDLSGQDVDTSLTRAQLLCRPPIRSEWQRAELPGGMAIALTVSRSPELHSLSDGRVLIRAGAENRPLSGGEIRQLVATKGSGDFEAELVPAARRADLDDGVIQEYITKREEKLRHKLTQPVEEILREAGITDEGNDPTVAGLLLVGKHPQAFLPQSGLVFVRFPGTQPTSGEKAGYGRREELTGPLPRLIEETWQIIFHEMRVGAVVTGLRRQETTEYPPFAVREALINAVAHRDYRLGGRRIELRMFDDRLEIISPGGLAGYITVDNIVEEHFSRNPRLVHGLYQWGYIEELGLGVDKMIDDMLAAGHPPPKFKAAPYSFTVTLSNVKSRAPMPPWLKNVSERQKRAVQYLHEHGRITNREYQSLCPDVSAETLRIDLADLVDKGLLIRIGDKKGTYYMLK
ncbi:MAG: putative DNA binding domain-containing protein [Chloroflexi bacterium]|nr:putative DNA binding domain-containing protein [Chloroflexota bacterium]